MMKYLVAAATLALAAGSAQATVTFNVNASFVSATGAPAGTLTGTFTTNDALSAIIGFDLTASASGAFAGFRYTTANSSVTAQVLPSQYLQIDSTGNVNELRLYFAAPLTRTGTTLNPTFSYENEPAGGNRSPSGAITAAAMSAVPEPATWAMMMLGFGGMAYAMRRKNKAAARIRFA